MTSAIIYKICPQCGVSKPHSDFGKDKNRKHGIGSWCRACASKRQAELYKISPDSRKEAKKKWVANNPERVKLMQKNYRKRHLLKAIMRTRMWRVKTKYGMSYQEYETRCTAVDNCCEICKKKCKLVVDHCHKRTVVRGLLCSPCNVMIGFSKDNPITLELAAKYLRERT